MPIGFLIGCPSPSKTVPTNTTVVHNSFIFLIILDFLTFLENPFDELDNIEDMINNIEKYMSNKTRFSDDDDDDDLDHIIDNIDSYINTSLTTTKKKNWDDFYATNDSRDLSSNSRYLATNEADLASMPKGSLKERIAQLYAVENYYDSGMTDRSDVGVDDFELSLGM